MKTTAVSISSHMEMIQVRSAVRQGVSGVAEPSRLRNHDLPSCNIHSGKLHTVRWKLPPWGLKKRVQIDKELLQ